MNARRMGLGVLGAAPLALAACGDVYVDTTPANSFTVGGPTEVQPPPTADTIPQNVLVECPEARPDEDSPCTDVGSTCEYGASPDTQCNATLSCEGDRQTGVAAWTAHPSKVCSMHDCPSGALASINGQPCDLPSVDGGAPSADDELLCPMDDGICACTTGPDAAHAHARMWVCVKPQLDCPVERPLSGHTCNGTTSCDYGSCLFKHGVRMDCKDVWLAGGSETCN
jgi:hypothetical protein